MLKSKQYNSEREKNFMQKTSVTILLLALLSAQAHAHEPIKNLEDNQYQVISQEGEMITFRRAAASQDGAPSLINDNIFVGIQLVKDKKDNCYQLNSKFAEIKTFHGQGGATIQLPEIHTTREMVKCPGNTTTNQNT